MAAAMFSQRDDLQILDPVVVAVAVLVMDVFGGQKWAALSAAP
jgi:hypothetical protein